MNFTMLITAFGGGFLGAAIGGAASLLAAGVLAAAIIFGGGVASPMVSYQIIGVLLGPQVAFSGAAAAAAYAGRKGLLESGSDLKTPLLKLRDPMVLVVGGAFGVIGFLIQYLLGLVFGEAVYTQTGYICCIALTVALAGLASRSIFTTGGLISGKNDPARRRYLPSDKQIPLLIVVGFAVGIAMGGLTALFGQLADGTLAIDSYGLTAASQEIREQAILLFQNSGVLAFAFGCIPLIFPVKDEESSFTAHIFVAAATAAMIIFANTENAPLAILAAGVVGILASLLGESIWLIFDRKMDSVLGASALTLGILQWIGLWLIATVFPATGIFV